MAALTRCLISFRVYALNVDYQIDNSIFLTLQLVLKCRYLRSNIP